MRQVESKYRQFPVALELPQLPSERQMLRAEHIMEWRDALGLRYNVDFISFEVQEGRGFRARTFMAWAFKTKAMALQFKLKFASY